MPRKVKKKRNKSIDRMILLCNKLQKLIKETSVKPLTTEEHKASRLNAYKPVK